MQPVAVKETSSSPPQQMRPIRPQQESKVDAKSKTSSLPVIMPSMSVEANTSGNSATYVDRIYLLTDDESAKNIILDRNKKILARGQYEVEVMKCKDMGLFNYQNYMKEILKTAKGQGYMRIMILNGNDPLNHKFPELYEKQLAKMNGDCYLWFLGNFKETSSRDILTTEFDLDDYLFLYDDIAKAKLTTQEKAHLHWKSYGHREGRYAKVDILNGSNQSISNNYGFIVSAEIYDTLIDLIEKQTFRDCKDVLTLIQTGYLDNKTVWRSRPDLVIPAFPNINNHNKNAQIAQKGGNYYNFFKLG